MAMHSILEKLYVRPRVAGSALSAALLLGCGHSDLVAETPQTQAELLAPPLAGHGVQFGMVTSLGAEAEAEHCRFVLAPPEDLLVQHDEAQYSAGGHHVLLYETDYAAIPTETLAGETVDTSGVFDCSDGATADWSVTKLIAGAQNGLDASVLSLPVGVALRVHANAVLLINAHYVNASSETIHPEIRINLHTISESALQQEANVLFLYNDFIKVPSASQARARMRCPVHHDITLVDVQSHMHRRGVGYGAMLAGKDMFYQHDSWQDVPVEHFREGMQVRAGERFDYYCDYENTEDRDIYQGPRSTDEMCILIASYYPSDPATNNCLTADGTNTAAEWVGDGTASCKQTFECLHDPQNAGLRRATDCMQQADPGVAPEVSALMRCAQTVDDVLIGCSSEVEACLSR